MQEKSILTDCLESIKHAAERYQEAAFEADHDHVRDTLQDIMIDRVEQQAAIFSLMHQMGLYETAEAPGDRIQKTLETYRRQAADFETRHREVEGEDATGAKER